MNQQLIGVPAPFGVLTTTAAWTGVITSVNKVQSVSLRDDFAKANFLDGGGNIIGRAGYNHERTLTVEVIFYSTTESLARTASVLAVMFDIVTIAGTGAAGIDGTWNYESGSYDGRQGDYHKYTLTLWQGGAGSAPASLAAAS
jgi:hypothetical protein